MFGDSDMFVTRVKHDAVLFRASLNSSIMQKINRNNEHNQSVRVIVYEGKYGIRLIWLLSLRSDDKKEKQHWGDV